MKKKKNRNRNNQVKIFLILSNKVQILIILPLKVNRLVKGHPKDIANLKAKIKMFRKIVKIRVLNNQTKNNKKCKKIFQ